MPRIDGRKNDELRPVEIIPNINKFAESSCLDQCEEGLRPVLCTPPHEEGAPPLRPRVTFPSRGKSPKARQGLRPLESPGA